MCVNVALQWTGVPFSSLLPLTLKTVYLTTIMLLWCQLGVFFKLLIKKKAHLNTSQCFGFDRLWGKSGNYNSVREWKKLLIISNRCQKNLWNNEILLFNSSHISYVLIVFALQSSFTTCKSIKTANQAPLRKSHITLTKHWMMVTTNVKSVGVSHLKKLLKNQSFICSAMSFLSQHIDGRTLILVKQTHVTCCV